MKEELENTMDLEQLLRGKSWEQLNEAEREAAVEALGSQAEYNHVRAMMMELRAETGIEEEELQPSKRIRENLLAAFDEEQRRRRVLWWNSLGFWLRDQLRLDIPIVRFAIAGVILVLGVFTVMQITESDTPEQTIANKQTPPAPVEENNKKLDDNVEPPGMNVQPSAFPWSFYTPTPVNPDEDEVVVVEEVIPPVKDSVIVPQPGNIAVMADSTSHELVSGVADTSASSPLVISFTNATICCGANTNVSATGAASYNWVWTNPVDASATPNMSVSNSNMANVFVVVPPNCRSLANDSKVIDAMFSMK